MKNYIVHPTRIHDRTTDKCKIYKTSYSAYKENGELHDNILIMYCSNCRCKCSSKEMNLIHIRLNETKNLNQERITFCMNCHKRYDESDYTADTDSLGEELLSEIGIGIFWRIITFPFNILKWIFKIFD